MMYRVVVRYFYFDFTDLQEACDFALKAKNSYVPEGKGDNPNICIRFLNEEDVLNGREEEEVEECQE